MLYFVSYILSLLFGVFILADNLINELKTKNVMSLLDNYQDIKNLVLLKSYVYSWVLHNRIYILFPMLFIPILNNIIFLYILIEFNKRNFIKITTSFFDGYVKGFYKKDKK